ncbi:Hypothetical protein MexAM1_META2p1034 (plasmid) [Methylorubrum extorquens AM1]|uniref:Uncharacterized protein n=1 Tax=Methylorubrum extorquens (strain ATCC 14718 / DSM 1338 / JCM 2805 / NCIMB 9133 / AM1) TaxID=272630 RepID=C5B5T9_METEA|nr:Hypothetical protein MexAM1_META2p1034 [Methylorubrum extorquens AM1]
MGRGIAVEFYSATFYDIRLRLVDDPCRSVLKAIVAVIFTRADEVPKACGLYVSIAASPQKAFAALLGLKCAQCHLEAADSSLVYNVELNTVAVKIFFQPSSIAQASSQAALCQTDDNVNFSVSYLLKHTD